MKAEYQAKARARYTVKVAAVDGGKWWMATITRGHDHVCLSHNFVDRAECERWADERVNRDIEYRLRG